MDTNTIKSALISLKQNRESAMKGEKPDLFQLEAEILYWHLQGLNNKQIGNKLGKESYYSTVHSVKYGIYQHFSRYPYNIQLGDPQVKNEVASVLEQAVGNPPVIEPWPPQSLKEEVGPKLVVTRPATVEEPNPEPEIKYLPMLYVEPDVPPPQGERNWWPIIGLIGFAVVVALFMSLVTWIDNRISSIEPPTITEIVEAIPDEPPQILPGIDETNTPVVVTQVVVEEVTREKVITATPPPNTPGPTPAPTNTSTPTATATPFQEVVNVFADGIDEENWTIVGTPVVSDGVLHPSSGELKLTYKHSLPEKFIVEVGYISEDIRLYLGESLRYGFRSSQWHDGDTWLANVPGGKGRTHRQIEVMGSTYNVYQEGELLGTLIYSPLEDRTVKLYVRNWPQTGGVTDIKISPIEE